MHFHVCFAQEFLVAELAGELLVALVDVDVPLEVPFELEFAPTAWERAPEDVLVTRGITTDSESWRRIRSATVTGAFSLDWERGVHFRTDNKWHAIHGSYRVMSLLTIASLVE